jgi:hypothetical protein
MTAWRRLELERLEGSVSCQGLPECMHARRPLILRRTTNPAGRPPLVATGHPSAVSIRLDLRLRHRHVHRSMYVADE